MADTCQTCGAAVGPNSAGLARASADQVKQINDAQRARWDAVLSEHQDLKRQIAATYKPRHRWSWWRFTLTVR